MSRTKNKMEFVDVEIDGIEHFTDNAVLVILPSGDEKWIPRSVLATSTDQAIEEGEAEDYIEVHDWFAKKEGLI